MKNTKPKIPEKINWQKEYRDMFEGANVWSSKAIDSQIDFIRKLLADQKKQIFEEVIGKDEIADHPESEMFIRFRNKFRQEMRERLNKI